MTRPKSKVNFKKYAVFTLMFIAFAGCLWLIFAPSAEDAQAGAGFNLNIPDPRGDGIVSDKKSAYEEEQVRERQQAKRQTLQDYAYLLGEPENGDPEVYERQLKMASVPPDYQEELNRQKYGDGYGSTGYDRRRVDAIRASGSAYSDLTATLGNLYEEPEPETAVIEEAPKSTDDDQLALLEKSFELAAKYMPGQGTAPVSDEAETRSRRTKVEAVTQVRGNVVSSLPKPISDAELIRQYGQERNFGFHTVGAAEQAAVRNTIAAVVHGDQVLTDGQSVRLRTTEPMRAGRTVIPPNTLITGMGRFTGERLEIAITSIEYGAAIISVELTAYDLDGQRGICIPRSMEIEAVKEVAGNLGQNMGTTINLSRQNAGGQILTDLGRGVIQGTSQYISKKTRQVKVTLKSGYRVLLLPSEN